MTQSTTATATEQRAYAYAFSHYFIIADKWDDPAKHYEAYTRLLTYYNDFADLDESIANVWHKFEEIGLDIVLQELEAMAQAIITITTKSLYDCKLGLVESAIEGTLPSDFNDLDMKALAQAGHDIHTA
ncbi:hypothetical protein ACT3UJ_07030 [Halomonas sp. 86]|uniref:hypothetical protein n=1 Tax=unclassified Halomonas TaxID=2609666 RepID=UPI004034D856